MTADLGELDAAGRAGRPRSERARVAVLHAVDDLLVDIGYSAMTMKGIAERAGVGRQTVYRWWSSKAEILLEACVMDARHELASRPRADPTEDLLGYLKALTTFLTTSPAGLAYRALIGEAQHDPAVRELVRDAELLTISAGVVLDRIRPIAPNMPELNLASVQLDGPVVAYVLTGSEPLTNRQLKVHVTGLLKAWRP